MFTCLCGGYAQIDSLNRNYTPILAVGPVSVWDIHEYNSYSFYTYWPATTLRPLSAVNKAVILIITQCNSLQGNPSSWHLYGCKLTKMISCRPSTPPTTDISPPSRTMDAVTPQNLLRNCLGNVKLNVLTWPQSSPDTNLWDVSEKLQSIKDGILVLTWLMLIEK